jgi:Ankyrin repeat
LSHGESVLAPQSREHFNRLEALNQPNRLGVTPFHKACSNGHITMIQILSSQHQHNSISMHPTISDENVATMNHTAMVLSVPFLLEIIAVNAMDCVGNTPFHSLMECIINNTRSDIVPLADFLIHHPLIRINDRNMNSQRPMDIALKHQCHYETFEHMIVLCENHSSQRRYMAFRYLMDDTKQET